MFENNVIDDNLPDITKISFKKIHKNHFKVILLNLALVSAILFGGLFFVIYKKLNKVIPDYTYLLYLGLGIFLLGLLLYFYIGFSRRKYALRERDISYKSGVLIKSLTTVPFNRIQHVEIE
ncbi:MAG: PH domain-containing protein, partial [Flavobacteriaceae bacterium]